MNQAYMYHWFIYASDLFAVPCIVAAILECLGIHIFCEMVKGT